jgi:2-iminobutanoate/2-iminopropanoate deaminase
MKKKDRNKIRHPSGMVILLAWAISTTLMNTGCERNALGAPESGRTRKRVIAASDAPAAIGPYSQAIEVNGTLYISGQIAIDPSTGKMISGGITEQTEQVMKNIGAILREAGYGYDHIVRSSCLLADIADFPDMNEVYGRYFIEGPPARATYAVNGLPLGALIEIETVAVK